MTLADWLPKVWTGTRQVRILDGGLLGGPVADRAVLAEITDRDRLARLRELTTTGDFTGDICRCPGRLTLALYDADDVLRGSATVHGHGSVSWERSRFRDDLDVAEPTALTLFLAECGVRDMLIALLGPLVTALGRYERNTHPQFRPPGKPAVLIERQVPEVLRAELLKVGGEQAGQLSPERAAALAQRLAGAVADPVQRAGLLLNWLGRLPFPTEAMWGEGVLVRRLLDDLPRPAVLAAAARAEPAGTLGVLNWAVHQDDDSDVVAVVDPVLRHLLP
ncbi:hypothetical protein [Micromonospora auratinigra]|uniref:Uncharacterized protein n=1 Tax=Micromonospora auratinigra TaxID=261654 RepID=A0A1A8ZJX9_9ACTN|nr:hypothetical protein [Micromonospora auratinigra]SBT44157.1 hypothetical protein GA0070611_2592 [Micromonospora auratinigra]